MRTATMGLAGALLLAGCSNTPGEQAPEAPAEPAGDNILHISWGGIAEADGNEAKRHWSTWAINLVDGGPAYGWLSDKGVTLPHALNFELAGTAKIDAVALDNRFEPVVREDGSMSQTAEGSPVRRFALLGSNKGPEGPYEILVEGEAKADARTVVKLPTPASARWLRLRIDSNWKGSGPTRLSDLAVLGTLDRRGDAAVADADASGVYSHEYGPILLRQQGNEIFGCYNDGLGTLRGTVFGRIMRLAWYSNEEGSIGAATLVAANGKLYGFWYRPEDKMGSPWNAVRESGLAGADLGKCRAALYPSS
ncbi:discoidin domain-containing protein [Sphingopyxis sp. SCN 67-31]|uniref:discoidin domain-containing protein n=1 Tax=Sphingopyxis sp. SCN 67-31 TaxID=1660142 RepID=UPI000A5C6905|nr:discoidin domain-containing protein [Sphingopyxis sp. SCN 67-31]